MTGRQRAAALLYLLADVAHAVNNGLARTPQMGWVSMSPSLPRGIRKMVQNQD